MYQQQLDQLKAVLHSNALAQTANPENFVYSFVTLGYSGKDFANHWKTKAKVDLFESIVENIGKNCITTKETSTDDVAKIKEINPDFHITALVRMLWLDLKNPAPIPTTLPNETKDFRSFRAEVIGALKNYPFWPSTKHEKMRGITFWSENHLLMHLGGAYLFNHYLDTVQGNDKFLDRRTSGVFFAQPEMPKLTNLLRIYLKAHHYVDAADGKEKMYLLEINSVTYQKYTLPALLNLVDFAPDEEIAHLARLMVDCSIRHLLQTVDPSNGIETYSGKKF